MLFGAGQIVAGALCARWLLVSGRWRQTRFFALLLLALWFVCSGVAELIVSSSELAHRLDGMPDSATFTRWRAGADTFLLWATLALFVALLAYPLFQRIRSRARSQAKSRVE